MVFGESIAILYHNFNSVSGKEKSKVGNLQFLFYLRFKEENKHVSREKEE